MYPHELKVKFHKYMYMYIKFYMLFDLIQYSTKTTNT